MARQSSAEKRRIGLNADTCRREVQWLEGLEFQPDAFHRLPMTIANGQAVD